MANEEVIVHLNRKPLFCGAVRRGAAVTGDISLVTCNGCKGNKKEGK